MGKKDYYEILGVKKNDSTETIKQSYKKLALKYHPDKISEDKKKEYENKFKEINEAYTILGDKNKRQKYDQGEINNYGEQEGFRGEGFEDILRDLFGNSFGGERRERKAGQDLQYQLKISLVEAAFGTKKEIMIQRDGVCESCNATGTKDNKFEECINCNGKGRIKINQRSPWGIISQVIECEECLGEGRIPKDKCQKCKGKGIIKAREKISINIPKGIANGQTLRIPGGGNAIRKGAKGDLYLLILVEPHKIFTREGFDIIIELPITFSQAALGTKISVPTLEGKKIMIKLKAGTQTGSVLRIKDQGIPIINDEESRGYQYIKIIVQTPKKLTRKQKELYKELEGLE